MKELLSQYSAIRDAELLALRRRQAAAFAKESALQALVFQETALRARRGLLLSSLQQAGSDAEPAGSDAGLSGPAEQIANDDRELQVIQAQIQALLQKHNLPGDELELRYRCPACKDTGYVQERRCACLERRLFERNGKLSNLAAFEKENFNAFDLSFVPEDNGQREGVRRLKEICFAYAESFPNTTKRNMLLFGSIGVGKSFMLNCVAAHVLQSGFSVRRLTAYQFIQMVMDMVRGGDPSALRELERVDLLVLDDLGSEPQIKNISTEQLYAVLDERLLAQRHTLFATNLGTEQLKDRYGERMVSRLLDTRITFCARLTGRDLRLYAQRAQITQK